MSNPFIKFIFKLTKKLLCRERKWIVIWDADPRSNEGAYMCDAWFYSKKSALALFDQLLDMHKNAMDQRGTEEFYSKRLDDNLIGDIYCAKVIANSYRH